MAFPENLQYLRSQNNVTQEQLAEKLDVSRQSVSKWESGTSFPELDTLLRICDLYDFDLDTLLRGDLAASLQADTVGYDHFMNRFSRRIAGSVGAIIAAVGVLTMLNGTAVPELLAVAFFLLVITVSVVILVASGIQKETFCKKHPAIQDFYTEEERDSFRQKFVWFIAGGIGAILFGVVLLLLFFNFFPEQSPYETIAGGVFLWIIAGAVSTFIYAGLQDEKYKIWKYNRDNDPSPEAKKRLGQIGAVCGYIMLLATAIYVGLGFTRNAWGTAWWVFPVGGILCGIVSTLLDPYKNEEP